MVHFSIPHKSSLLPFPWCITYFYSIHLISCVHEYTFPVELKIQYDSLVRKLYLKKDSTKETHRHIDFKCNKQRHMTLLIVMTALHSYLNPFQYMWVCLSCKCSNLFDFFRTTLCLSIVIIDHQCQPFHLNVCVYVVQYTTKNETFSLVNERKRSLCVCMCVLHIKENCIGTQKILRD